MLVNFFSCSEYFFTVFLRTLFTAEGSSSTQIGCKRICAHKQGESVRVYILRNSEASFLFSSSMESALVQGIVADRTAVGDREIASLCKTRAAKKIQSNSKLQAKKQLKKLKKKVDARFKTDSALKKTEMAIVILRGELAAAKVALLDGDNVEELEERISVIQEKLEFKKDTRSAQLRKMDEHDVDVKDIAGQFKYQRERLRAFGDDGIVAAMEQRFKIVSTPRDAIACAPDHDAAPAMDCGMDAGPNDNEEEPLEAYDAHHLKHPRARFAGLTLRLQAGR